jgi:hypothetical protein
MEVHRHLIPWMETSKEDICAFEQDPAMWSEDTISETIRIHGSTTAGVQDLRSFIRDYLKVACGVSRKAGAF